MLDALELPEAWLPPALESPSRSAETPAGIPVAAGAGDQAAGALGVGVTAPGPASIVLGTSGVAFAVPSGGRWTRRAGRMSSAMRCRASWHAMGVMLSAAGSLELAPRLRRARRGLRRRCSPRPRAGSPGVEGLLFLPYLAGERTPHVDPHARGAFVGLSLRHDRGALVRAVLEGVAYGLRDSFEILRALGCRLDVGRVSGGGARSELWLRIVASVLGLPLERTAVEEGAAYGAALLGGVAGGVFADVQQAVASCGPSPRDRSSPTRPGKRSTRKGTAATAPCIRH